MRLLSNAMPRDEYNEQADLELAAVGVPRVFEMGYIEGRLGAFAFRREEAHWAVKGCVPAAIDEEVYADPIGRRDVRIGGHCGQPAPEGDVHVYHVDSMKGLQLLVGVLRRHGLVPDEYQLHEVLDRAYVLCDDFDRHICDHSAVKADAELAAAAEKASDALHDFYQLVGKRRFQ